MAEMQVKMRVHGVSGVWFDAKIEVGPVLGSNNLTVVKTDVVVFKSVDTIPIFETYKEGQVFTYETANGDHADVYYTSESATVYGFSTHPHLL